MSETTKYQVATPRVLWEYVTVEVPNDIPEDEIEDYAIDQAFEEGPSGICAHCSGGRLMRQAWSRELSDDVLEVVDSQTSLNIRTEVTKVEG